MTEPIPEVPSSADVTAAEEVVSIFLPPGPKACPAARRAMLAESHFFPSSLKDDVATLVAELVGNAVRHACGGMGQPVRVELRRWADFVRVEVSGEGAGFTAEGRALVLVDRIADRWGIAPPGSATCAWFEIPTSDEREATSAGFGPRDDSGRLGVIRQMRRAGRVVGAHR